MHSIRWQLVSPRWTRPTPRYTHAVGGPVIRRQGVAGGKVNKPGKAKTVTSSQVEMTEIVNPEDTNPLGTIFGGRVMALIDKAAAVASMRHCRRTTVTVSVDRVDFISPIRLGMIVTVLASVNQAFRTSLEVGVKV